MILMFCSRDTNVMPNLRLRFTAFDNGRWDRFSADRFLRHRSHARAIASTNNVNTHIKSRHLRGWFNESQRGTVGNRQKIVIQLEQKADNDIRNTA